MARINQEIVEFAFSPKSTMTYTLQMLVGTDSIYYTINDAQKNVLALKSFHFDQAKNRTAADYVREVFFEDALLKLPYYKTCIVFTTTDFTLIPSKFYDEKNPQSYFDNLTGVKNNEQIAVDNVKHLNFKNLYLVDNQLFITTKTLMPEASCFHIFTPLILGFHAIAAQRKGYQVFTNIRDGQLQILFFDGGDFIFANSYFFKSPQDVIYFILNVYEQFKLSPDMTPLSISGSLTEDSDIFKFIYRYIRHVSFIATPPELKFGQQFTGIPQHFYFDLFSIIHCTEI